MKKLLIIKCLIFLSFSSYGQSKYLIKMTEVYNKTSNGNLYILERSDVFYTVDFNLNIFSTEIKNENKIIIGKVNSVKISKPNPQTIIYKFKWVVKKHISNVTITFKNKLEKVIVNIDSIGNDDKSELVGVGNLK